MKNFQHENLSHESSMVIQYTIIMLSSQEEVCAYNDYHLYLVVTQWT